DLRNLLALPTPPATRASLVCGTSVSEWSWRSSRSWVGGVSWDWRRVSFGSIGWMSAARVRARRMSERVFESFRTRAWPRKAPSAGEQGKAPRGRVVDLRGPLGVAARDQDAAVGERRGGVAGTRPVH